MLDTRLDRKREKELKVFELYQQGLSYRKIAKEARLSLRDVAKYIHRISNKTKSPSTTSLMDEVVLEYRVNLLRSQVRDLNRAQKFNILTQLHARQSELDVVKRNLEYERFSDEVFKDISNQDQITI